jgi:hypothetical protein
MSKSLEAHRVLRRRTCVSVAEHGRVPLQCLNFRLVSMEDPRDAPGCPDRGLALIVRWTGWSRARNPAPGLRFLKPPPGNLVYGTELVGGQ